MADKRTKLSLKGNRVEAFSTGASNSTRVLSIAGSDPTGAAGIYADLRTFAAVGVRGVAAVTAVTAQNSQRVSGIYVIPSRALRAQLYALADEFDIAAIKIGMLGASANIRVVAAFLRDHPRCRVVLDPVLVSTSGTALLPTNAHRSLANLFSLVDVLTPNRPEAAALLGRTLPARKAVWDLLQLGPHAVLLKGGHARGGIVVDYLADQDGIREFRHPRLPFDARGTGCVLSSAIAAFLARSHNVCEAVTAAEDFLQQALRKSVPSGRSRARVLLV